MVSSCFVVVDVKSIGSQEVVYMNILGLTVASSKINCWGSRSSREIRAFSAVMFLA
jgi:hypothetical protein